MKIIGLLMLLLLSEIHARAQDESITLDDLMQSAGEWARQNLDEDVLRALQNQDQAKVKQLFDELQKQLQGEYVIDLAAFRGTASAILPILQRHEETLPYALWLKTQLDYLEVADQLDARLHLSEVVRLELPFAGVKQLLQLLLAHRRAEFYGVVFYHLCFVRRTGN